MRFQGSFELRPIIKQPMVRPHVHRGWLVAGHRDCDVDARTSTCGFSIVGVGTIKVRHYVIVTQNWGDHDLGVEQ
jgi:hypothetical protein